MVLLADFLAMNYKLVVRYKLAVSYKPLAQGLRKFGKPLCPTFAFCSAVMLQWMLLKLCLRLGRMET